MKFKNKNKKGVMLSELLVTIAIIIILAGATAPFIITSSNIVKSQSDGSDLQKTSIRLEEEINYQFKKATKLSYVKGRENFPYQIQHYAAILFNDNKLLLANQTPPGEHTRFNDLLDDLTPYYQFSGRFSPIADITKKSESSSIDYQNSGVLLEYTVIEKKSKKSIKNSMIIKTLNISESPEFNSVHPNHIKANPTNVVFLR